MFSDSETVSLGAWNGLAQSIFVKTSEKEMFIVRLRIGFGPDFSRFDVTGYPHFLMALRQDLIKILVKL